MTKIPEIREMGRTEGLPRRANTRVGLVILFWTLPGVAALGWVILLQYRR